ncbi:MAG TPA: DUF2403 domain-containing protein [Polyangiaceae bacterium]|jgi:hypothetical protein
MKRTRLGACGLAIFLGIFACSNGGSSSPNSNAGSTNSGGQSSTSGSGPVAGNTSSNGGSSANAGTSAGGSGNTSSGGTTSSSAGTSANAGSAGMTPSAGGGLGTFSGIDFGAPSDGGTVTFQTIGKAGSFPSVCAPNGNMCCRQTKTITSNMLTPWDEDLIMTLRGPLDIKQFATYQPVTEGQPGNWQMVASWDVRTPSAAKGISFSGDATPNTPFSGIVGSTCLVNAATDQAFGCGPMSSPYCAANSPNKNSGWSGSKMFVFLASMPHVGSDGITTAQNCSPVTNGWHDAPWIGLSVGELIRAGAFSSCQCYEVTQYHGDGCGQINALEVINDNDTTGNYKNLEIFSSNFFGYAGDFGGPCGTNNCDTTGIPATVDLVSGKMAAASGALGSGDPIKSPNGFLRRPTSGYRYFILLLDVSSRTVQYAEVHPANVPASLGALLPSLPSEIPQSTIDSVIQLRLPH